MLAAPWAHTPCARFLAQISIVQRLKPFLYKDLVLRICLFCVLTPCARFHEGLSPGETPGVHTPRPCPLNGAGIPARIFKIFQVAEDDFKASERAPKCLVRPEDLARHSWTTWNRVSRYLKSNFVRRSQLFDWMKTLENILVISDSNETSSSLSFASNQLNRISGKSPCPDPKYDQLCLGF